MAKTLQIHQNDLGTRYPLIGTGDEGYIYKYNDEIALKIFTKIRVANSQSKYRRKLLKLKDMISTLRDPNCAFPLGFVTFNGIDIVGIYLPLVKKHYQLTDFDDLPTLIDKNKIIQYLIKADKCIQRLHQQQIILGDIKQNNILVNENEEPIFIDTDNYQYKHHIFDLIPDRAGCLYYTYGTSSMCLQDNDILVYAIMSLYLLTQDERFYFCSPKESLSAALHALHLEKEILKELEYIFSPRLDKPYIGPILEKVNINRM